MTVGRFILVHTGKFPTGLAARSGLLHAGYGSWQMGRRKERQESFVCWELSARAGRWRLIFVVVHVRCRAQTQFKALLTLANGQTLLPASPLRVGERRRGIREAYMTECILIEKVRRVPWQQSGSSISGPLLTYSGVIFKRRFHGRIKTDERRNQCGV